MEPAELDKEIEELETRVERLRALYEQYFLGIEKIEPMVPRKDVERRIWRLRREQIRNTGKRFRLQTIIQRYNTFQQYWMRICREIEAGTYTRHLARAKKIMADAEPLTVAARKRKRAHQRALDKQEREEEARRERAETAMQQLEDLADLLDQPGALDSAMASVDQLLSVPEPVAPSASPSPRRSAPSRRPRRSRGGRLDELDLDLDVVEGKLQPSQAPPPKPQPPAPARPPPARPANRPPPQPPPARPGQPPAAGQMSGPVPPGQLGAPPPPAPGPHGRPTISGPRRPGPGRPTVSGPGRGPGAPGGRPRPPGPGPRPGPPGPGRPPPAQQPPGHRPPGPRPTAAGPRPASAGTPPARGPTPRPVTPPRETRPRSPAPTTTGPHPFGGGRPEQKASGGLTENRVRELHTKLTAAKRQTNDKSSVSVDGLRKSLESAEAKLRTKHGAHRKVDFDVVIKDGKAVVKPVVK